MIFRPNPDVRNQVIPEATPQVKGRVTAEVIKMLKAISMRNDATISKVIVLSNISELLH